MNSDAVLEQYDLLESDAHNNWFLIEDISSDSLEVSGSFQLSFITSHEEYLSGERERWDDPNRPDTLHFTNGKFRAAFSDF